MPLSWNEIRTRAATFADEWQHERSEDAEAKSFWDGFFHIFGISRRRVATFEQAVKKLDGKQGYIDLFWKGTILIEHKSRGKDLDRAFSQAKDYFPGLKEHELPKYILVSDFERFRLYNLETDEVSEFLLSDLVSNVHQFDFIAGYQRRVYKEQDPVNIKAAELMGKLHDQLKDSGYTGHQLELYLVRLLFCLFADDTTIFERGTFEDYIVQRTSADGSDVGGRIEELFQNLNKRSEDRFRTLDVQIASFPYVNGNLFSEMLPIAAFDARMRETLLECCGVDWGAISPAIFGSLFQSAMDVDLRRNLGAHYTSEQNILKLIKPLFLDDLYEEFEACKSNRQKLAAFHDKIASLRFLDPACGCGNFLIIAYRELRLLELEVVRQGWREDQLTFTLEDHLKVNIDQFYGIEYDEFPAQIAQVAMWLIDHQMNMMASQQFGRYYIRLPLSKGANIKHGNALKIDWQSLLPPSEADQPLVRYDYIMGNPPFVGSKMMTTTQRQDLLSVFGDLKGVGTLDYVGAWYCLASRYISTNPATRFALVSTNSITQGEQVGILWPFVLYTCKLDIFFAHRTFQWSNEAGNNAAVFCVIIGLTKRQVNNKRLYFYETPKSLPLEQVVDNINPYLVDAKNVIVSSRSQAINQVPAIGIGNKPIDDGNFLFSTEEKQAFLKREPRAERFFKRWYGAHEYLHNVERWCLWLGDSLPSEIRSMPLVHKIVTEVQQFRAKSSSIPTQVLAKTPTRFHVENMPAEPYITLPKTSSERRKYIPVSIVTPEILVGDAMFIVADSQLYTFGVLSSIMHMTWTKYVCGRLKSDLRYSASIVYNNYPWPEVISPAQRKAIEKAAKSVIEIRGRYSTQSLADLYDPITMPADLLKAHEALDKAVDLCYRPQPFVNESKRMEFLFELYEKYTAGLFAPVKKSRKRTTN